MLVFSICSRLSFYLHFCSIHSTIDVSCPAEITGGQWKFFVNGVFQNVGSSTDLNLNCQKGKSMQVLVYFCSGIVVKIFCSIPINRTTT